MSRDDDSLLSRWSRRKRGVVDSERSSAPDGSSSRPVRAEEGPEGPEAALSEAELLETLGLPDPDTLQQGDDFAAFMAKTVPAALRQRALRKLWTSNPLLANLDGLIDHGEDYTDAATVPAVFRTAYRVGEGFLREALEAPPTEPEPVPEETAIAASDAPDDTPNTATTTGKATGTDAIHPDDAPLRPRRMTFRPA